MTATTQNRIEEDLWIPTSCGQCYCMCGIKVRRQDGVITEIEGNPDAPTGRGSICPKGLASPHLDQTGNFRKRRYFPGLQPGDGGVGSQ